MRACAEFVGYVIITLMRAIKLFSITTLLTLAGCATGPEAPTAVASSSATPASAAPLLEVDDSQLPYADIPHEQLRQLLEAEFAIRARDLELGLEKLLAASVALPDPAVARRALQLAQFLRNRDAILSMAQRVSDLAPEDAEAATFAAALLIERGDIVTALPYSKRAFASSSDINPAALLNGFKGQPVQTQRLIKDLIIELNESYPNEPRTLFAKALLALREGQAAASEEFLMTLLFIEPYH